MSINPAQNPIRVVLADDHAILRSGLTLLINAQSDMQVVGESGFGDDIAGVLARTKADVLLLDISMPGNSGLQALKEVHLKHPTTKVIMLTMHDNLAFVRYAMSAGASGFVLKQAADQELIAAIRAVRKGGVFVDPSLAGALLGMSTPTSAGELLSERELEVLKLVAQGFSNSEIAGRIYVSIKTVETYRTRIRDKLGLRTRTEITRYALATGLLNTSAVLGDQSAA
jgi:two-component system, NarL family, response regulator NreC